jgi:phosphopantetheinyl transferase
VQFYRIISQNIEDISFRKIDTFSSKCWEKPFLIILDSNHVPSEEISSNFNLLSVDEQEKAMKFRFQKDRESFIVTHGYLRQFLGKFLDLKPRLIEFKLNAFGKPVLVDQYRKINFNLTHSAGISVLAFDVESETGVDVEKIDPEFDYTQIANRYFTGIENKYIHESTTGSRSKFYELWTRKEAFIKAIGSGIGENLDVPVTDGINSYYPDKPIKREHGYEFFIRSFSLPGQYIISVARHSVCDIIAFH